MHEFLLISTKFVMTDDARFDNKSLSRDSFPSSMYFINTSNIISYIRMKAKGRQSTVTLTILS